MALKMKYHDPTGGKGFGWESTGVHPLVLRGREAVHGPLARHCHQNRLP